MPSFSEKPLAQARVGSAVAIYSVPTVNTSSIIKTITICNTSAGPAAFRLFFALTDASFIQATASYFDFVIGATDTKLINSYFVLTNTAGRVGFSPGETSSALTITLWGAEIG